MWKGLSLRESPLACLLKFLPYQAINVPREVPEDLAPLGGRMSVGTVHVHQPLYLRTALSVLGTLHSGGEHLERVHRVDNMLISEILDSSKYSSVRLCRFPFTKQRT